MRFYQFAFRVAQCLLLVPYQPVGSDVLCLEQYATNLHIAGVGVEGVLPVCTWKDEYRRVRQRFLERIDRQYFRLG